MHQCSFLAVLITRQTHRATDGSAVRTKAINTVHQPPSSLASCKRPPHNVFPCKRLTWDGTSFFAQILSFVRFYFTHCSLSLDMAVLRVSETAKAEHLPTLERNNPMDPHDLFIFHFQFHFLSFGSHESESEVWPMPNFTLLNLSKK